MNIANSLYLGSLRGETFGLSEQVGAWQREFIYTRIEKFVEDAIVHIMLNEFEGVSAGNTEPFFLLKGNKDAREAFRDAYYNEVASRIEKGVSMEHWSRPLDDLNLSLEEKNRLAANIRLKFSAKKQAEPKILISKELLAKAKAQLEHTERALWSERGISATLVDEVSKLVEGNPNALHFSQRSPARMELREELYRLSEVGMALPTKKEICDLIENTGSAVRSRTRTPQADGG